MKKIQITRLAMFLLSFSLLFSSCYKEEVIYDESYNGGVIPGTGLPDWTTATHSPFAAPDYSVVLPQERVNRIDVVIGAGNWAFMMADLTNEFGPFGSDISVGKTGDDDMMTVKSSDFTPVFVPASVFYNGKEWYYVGVRFKGGSDLQSAWEAGNMKLAFRFDFDEFEDEYPAIRNQRFYGFQKLNFANNYEDVSFMHEKVASDIFRNAGIKAPQTAYYRLYIDHGEGAEYFGLYTAVEIVEDTMLDNQFGSNSGNCYKPDGASFMEGTFSISTFEKENNEDLADYSDVQNMITYLNADTRTSDPTQWHSDFESVFDVDNFMNWLAVNTVIQNWDTYGKKTHNFYLYNNPASQKLVWIPYDNDEALYSGQKTPLSLSMNEVTTSWPLIRYLIDTPEYKEMYLNYLQQTIDGAFNPADTKEKVQYYYNLIQPYVNGSDGEVSGYTYQKTPSDFPNAMNTLKEHIDNRFIATSAYLATQ